MLDNDISQQLQQRVEQAIADKTPLAISAGNSKKFYGSQTKGTLLDISQHSGIINYEPTELVVTVRAGTNLKQLEEILGTENQMFGFEPPAYAETATIGGTIACNLSGPRRPFSGAARDFVLGSKIINGKGEIIHFGGEVMKNVAGYDLSRLMVGAFGTLGVLLEVSLKVLPLPKKEKSFTLTMSYPEAFKKIQHWISEGQPISAACYHQDSLYIRLSGAEKSVDNARQHIQRNNTLSELEAEFWLYLKEQQLPFFKSSSALWRISLPPAAAPIQLPGEQLIDWGGALRWMVMDNDETEIRIEAEKLGGHAQLFRPATNDNAEISRNHPLSPGLFKLHQGIKQAMDPKEILNPGYLFPQL